MGEFDARIYLGVLRSSFEELEEIARDLIDLGEDASNPCVAQYLAYKSGYELLFEEVSAVA